MAKQTFQLVTNEQAQYDSVEYQIQSGQITPQTFETLDPATQALVLQVLFDMNTKDKINTYVADTSLEYLAVGLAHLFFQLVPYTPATPPTPFDELYLNLKNMVDGHDMPADGASWFVQYLMDHINQAKSIREGYIQQKISITGSF